MKNIREKIKGIKIFLALVDDLMKKYAPTIDIKEIIIMPRIDRVQLNKAILIVRSLEILVRGL